MSTLVVTRPQPDAALWVQQLQNQGIDAYALPMIVIGPSCSKEAVAAVQTALEQLFRYQALMFVSANAVRYFFAQLRHQKLALPPSVRFWSPGPGTSRALISEGISPLKLIQPALDAPQFDSEHLWLQAQHHVQPGDAVLIVRGGDGRQAHGVGRAWLTEQLEQGGVRVDFAPVYERQAPAVSPELLSQIATLRMERAVWLFSSSECLQHLVNCNTSWSWGNHTAFVTHPRIAQQARQAGFGQIVQTQPTIQGVMASIKSLHDIL